MANLGKAGENLKKVDENLKGITESASFTEDALKSVASTIQEAIQTAVEKMDDLDSISKKVAKSYERDIVNGIKKLGPSLEKSTSIQLKLIQGLDASKEIEQEMQSALAQKLVLEQRLQRLKDRGILSSEEILQLEGEIADITGYINNELENQADSNQSIIDSLGIVGNTLSGINAIAPKFAKALNTDKIEQDMAKAVGQARALGKELTRSQVIGIGLKSAFSNLGKTLTDPAVIFSTLVASAYSVSQDVNNIQKSTGMSYGNATALNAELRMTSQLQGQIQISTEKLHKAYAAVTTELGVAGDILGGEALISVSNLTDQLGMSAKEATQLALMSRLQGENTEEILSDTIATVGEFNKQNKTAINYKAVLSDVANSSKRLQVSLGANPKALTEAATAAASLGLSLKDVEQIADSLLNFETSIQKEMEAELLTGQQLNLEKAREFALNNDIKGLSEEISKNQGIINAFASGNRIQQKAIAEAMGLSVEQLGNMYYQQELNNLSAEEFKARYGETAYEQAKALSASEKFEASMNRVKEVIGNIGMALAPVLDLIAFIVSKWYVLYPLMGIVALSYIPSMVSGFKDFTSNISKGFDMLTGLGGKVQEVAANEATDSLAESVAGVGSDVATDAMEGASEAALGADNISPGLGEKIQEFFEGLAEGLEAMASTDVLLGAVAALLSAPGLIALGLAAPGLLLLSMIPGPAINATLTGLGEGLASLGNALMGPQLLGLAAGLALLTGSIIGIGFALKLAAPAFEAIGTIITSIFEGVATVITSAAEGFTMLLGAITFEKAAALPLVGLGLMSLAGGVTALALVSPLLPITALGILFISDALIPLAESTILLGPSIETLSSNLISLASATPQLFGVAAGLGAISAGLTSMAVTGLLALPVIGALTALGTVSGALSSIFGGEEGDKEDKGSMKAIEQKLDQLIAVVSAGGDVYIDGAKVGKTVALATSRIG